MGLGIDSHIYGQMIFRKVLVQVHTCNPSFWEAEIQRITVPGQASPGTKSSRPYLHQ
jgi:hypothetical protein